MKDDKDLIWHQEGSKQVFQGPVFSVDERYCRSPNNKQGTYSILNAKDWVIVIPFAGPPISGLDRKCILVKQWRHGEQSLSLEFPGGVLEEGESPEDGARRELLEETGFYAGTLQYLGSFNPNPAIMSNHVFFYLAENLDNPEDQHLDEDEYVSVETVLFSDICKNLGRPPYIHALMGSALSLYFSFSRS